PPPPRSREQLRSRRRWPTPGRTLSLKRTSKRDLELARMQTELLEQLEPLGPIVRPTTRADCIDGPRPCPFVGCVHHLYLDATPKGSIKLNFPDLEPWELRESCCLDVASRDGATLEDVGGFMNLTRERVRQIEGRALAKVAVLLEGTELREAYGTVERKP